jgi:hypothetical protein
MAYYERGIKAGLAAATVYLIISVILGLTHFSYQFPDVTTAAGLIPAIPQGASTVYSLIGLVASWVSFCVVRGIIFGAVFSALYNFLPGVTSVRRGMVLSSSLWIVAVVEVICTSPGWPPIGGWTYYDGIVSLSPPSLVLVGIMSALIFGALTGFLWNRFSAKNLVEARKGSAVLLLSFIVGGVLWAVTGPLYVIGVVIRGASLWESIGLALVAVIGLPGWVLALVAWRKTKRGKSGFKWGVAGGVIMALTGIMLLPGILAIIGGVLSGRKPATEPGTATIGQ